MDLITKLIPNVTDKLGDFGKAIIDTLIMVGISGIFAFIFGLILGVTITVTKNEGILEHKTLNKVLNKLIDFFRSIPFIILLTWMIPISRGVMGTAIGVKGAILPLICGTIPFLSRQIESALTTVDKGLIEAATAMGLSPIEIITKVYLKESIAAIAKGTAITLISLVGLTAMAGAVGAGGLGDFAIRYGHDRNMTDVTWVTVIVVFILVSLIQLIGNTVEKKNSH